MRSKRAIYKRGPGNLTGLSSIIPATFKSLKLDAVLQEQEIAKIWGKVVGKKIFLKSQPYKIIGSTLYVKVSSSPWMQELNYMKGMILDKLNEKLEEKKIDEIIFKLGRLGSSPLSVTDKPAGAVRMGKPPWLKVRLGKEDKDSIQKNVAFIKDPDIKDAFIHILTQEKRLKKFKRSRVLKPRP